MTIKEVEGLTGLSRSVIRFYEKEELIDPKRNETNGYREYVEKDLDDLKKIACLRTLGLSVEQIKQTIRHEVDLAKIIRKQNDVLIKQQLDLHNARLMCEKILTSKERIDFDNLNIERYVDNLNEYWDMNHNIFKVDSIGFFYLWGEIAFWALITITSILIAIFSINFLPDKIPVQWNAGVPSTLVNRWFIFSFPVACVIIKYMLRPFIWRWYENHFIRNDVAVDYITNSCCFIALVIEVFIVYSTIRETPHIELILIAIVMILLGAPIAMRNKAKKE